MYLKNVRKVSSRAQRQEVQRKFPKLMFYRSLGNSVGGSDTLASPLSLTFCSGKARNEVSLYPSTEIFIILLTL